MTLNTAIKNDNSPKSSYCTGIISKCDEFHIYQIGNLAGHIDTLQMREEQIPARGNLVRAHERK